MKIFYQKNERVWVYVVNRQGRCVVRQAVVCNEGIWPEVYMLRWIGVTTGKVVTRGCAFSMNCSQMYATKKEAICEALSFLGSGLQSVRQDISLLTARLTDAQRRQSNIATQIHELMKELAK